LFQTLVLLLDSDERRARRDDHINTAIGQIMQVVYDLIIPHRSRPSFHTRIHTHERLENIMDVSKKSWSDVSSTLIGC
jgi:hypothetical protein